MVTYWVANRRATLGYGDIAAMALVTVELVQLAPAPVALALQPAPMVSSLWSA